jgi:hypothetical protein
LCNILTQDSGWTKWNFAQNTLCAIKEKTAIAGQTISNFYYLFTFPTGFLGNFRAFRGIFRHFPAFSGIFRHFPSSP